MADTKIEWTEKVWNPVVGCTPTGERCRNCYAARMARRLKEMGRPEYQDVTNERGWNGKVTLIPEKLTLPMRWKKPARIFVDSMGDWMHSMIPQEFIFKMIDVMRSCHWHTFQTLTGRPARAASLLRAYSVSYSVFGNALVGCSIATQQEANNHLVAMRALRDMGWRTLVSHEPALEVVNWTGWEFLDWMVCGGESGPGARWMPVQAPRAARDFCKTNGIPFLFKQWGHLRGNYPHETWMVYDDAGWNAHEKKGGRVLDGKLWDEYPPEYDYNMETNAWTQR